MYFQKPPLGTQLDWSNPLNKGCVMHLAMNEGNGNTLQNLSMHMNHRAMHGFAYPPTVTSGWNPGRNGVGLNFDGVNDYVHCGNDTSLNITNAITVCCWIKPTVVNSWDQSSILVKTDAGVYQWKLGLTDVGEARFDIYNTQILKDRADGGNVVANEWCCLVGSHDGEYIRVYIDGVEADNTSFPHSIQDVSPVLRVGLDIANARYFTGSIDEVHILNRAMTANEVLDYYIDPYQVYLDEDD